MPETATEAKRATETMLRWPTVTMVGAAGALLLVAVSLGVHAYEYPGSFRGFAAWTDQTRYLVAAHAWALGNLSPSEHHYPPYYPLLGAAFVWLTPWQPFMIPDALCWAACLPLFLLIARRLAPGWPPAVVAVCFLVGTLGGRRLLELWVIPWTTTGVAPWQFGALLLALRFGERPGRRRAFALGLALGIAAGFRPSDAAILLAAAAPYAIVRAARTMGWRAGAPLAAAAALGFAIGAAPAVAAHLAVFGTSPGMYLGGATSNGFEWRLLPMRWVMLVVDARPLLPTGLGLAEVFPWVLPGIGGMVLALVARRPDARFAPAALVAGTIALHWTLYLSYRDLQPYGLWRFDNVHYFKWTFPFLVLWAARLLVALFSPARRTLALGALAACLLLTAWRPVLTDRAAAEIVRNGQTLVLPGGLSPLSAAIRLPLQGSFDALYFDLLELHAGGRRFENTRDFKVLPVPDGALLVPLRTLPAGPATLDLLPGITLVPQQTAETARQALVFGVPCGLVWWRPSCRPGS